jgi:hypothetical protein
VKLAGEVFQRVLRGSAHGQHSVVSSTGAQIAACGLALASCAHRPRRIERMQQWDKLRESSSQSNHRMQEDGEINDGNRVSPI